MRVVICIAGVTCIRGGGVRCMGTDEVICLSQLEMHPTVMLPCGSDSVALAPGLCHRQQLFNQARCYDNDTMLVRTTSQQQVAIAEKGTACFILIQLHFITRLDGKKIWCGLAAKRCRANRPRLRTRGNPTPCCYTQVYARKTLYARLGSARNAETRTGLRLGASPARGEGPELRGRPPSATEILAADSSADHKPVSVVPLRPFPHPDPLTWSSSQSSVF
jgi:hypothetical protein